MIKNLVWHRFRTKCNGKDKESLTCPLINTGREHQIASDFLFPLSRKTLLNMFFFTLLGKGILYLKSTWRKVSSCPKRGFQLITRGCLGCCRRESRLVSMENFPQWGIGEELDFAS